MTSAQARLADTIETFYNASDRTSDGAMAGHAFKSAVEELDNSVQREMVRGRFARMGDRKARSRLIFFFFSLYFRKHRIVRVSWSRSAR